MKIVLLHPLAMCAVLGGLLLLVAGLLWPLAATEQWSQEQAQEFAEASAAQITAAHESLHAPGELTAKMSAELRATRQRFEKIKSELESARQRPAEVAFRLKSAGATLAAIGLVMLIASHKQH